MSLSQTNPLHENCRGYQESPDGKVVGVQLGIYPVVGSEYEVYSVYLVDETQARGQSDFWIFSGISPASLARLNAACQGVYSAI